jgi:hypothetical protein
MALDTNFNVNPYYDDYDEDKKFLRMLFKPGYAVQARELTQLQTILQKQVQRFGNSVYKNGSVVTGGQTFFQNVTYLKLDSTFLGSAVTANNFIDKTLVDDNTNPTKKALVLKTFDADAGTGDPKTLLVKYIYGTEFAAGDTIKTYETNTVSANIATAGTGTGQIFSVNEGVYYYEGFFVKNDAQTIAVSKYSNTANARVGFEITESTVSYTSDTTLLDPAQDASNYQAPGSDRYKINLTLSQRSIDSTDDTQFLELARIQEGALTKYNRFPIYSVLEDTLARRTYDESGNYTVRPFNLTLNTSAANTANMELILSPGKAYVYGYEFETVSPTTLIVPKPRETDSVIGKRITADYGYYVYANTLYGTLPINSLQTVDLHCVPNSQINVTSTATISNTKIGTARIKSIEFDSTSNTSNSSTYQYKAFLFDVNVGSLTGTVNTAINVSAVQIANTMIAANNRLVTDNAYIGAKFRITNGPGLGEPARMITNYSGVNQTITIDPPFVTTLTNASAYSIDFEFNDVNSIVVTNGAGATSRVAAIDIDQRSKDHSTVYDDVFISDTNTERLLFKLGENFIANSSITGLSLSYRRLYESVGFSSGLQSSALAVGTGEALSTATSTSTRQANYQVVVTAAGSSAYEVGKTIPANLFTVDQATRKITITNGLNLTANVYATIDATAPNPKTKTYTPANTSLQLSAGVNIFANGGVNLYASNGQIQIAANNIVRVPSVAQSLYTPDVIRIVSVLDFNNTYITQANVANAIDVTSRYTLDTGQRDSFYDHSSIKLKPGYSAPVGPIVVKFDKFSSSGAGFFTNDSYSSYTYENIPTYIASTGTSYSLRDCLDFRPVRATATAATANSVIFDVDSSSTGPKIPENGSDILLSYSYYLPRNDKIVLNKDKTFQVLKGVSSLYPDDPKDNDNSMTLYILRNPAYVANTSNVSTQFINHRRYTMRDIGVIEKRIENLEYYTSLSLLEQNTVSKQDLTILDAQNLPRFKNGIIVDSFTGSGIADVAQPDYKASIDPKRKELRPSFNVSSISLQFDSANSSGFTQNGTSITVSSTDTMFIDQPKASKATSINPFNITNYIGKIAIDPTTDIWLDTTRQPDVKINLGGSADAWSRITSLTSPYDYTWGAWQDNWTGTSTSTQQVGQIRTGNLGFWGGDGRTSGMAQILDVYQTTTTATGTATRSGVVSTVVPETITQNIGDRLVDLSIIPYMRSKGILMVGSDFKPNTTLYPFFDTTAVEAYTNRANKFTLQNNNLGYRTEIGNFEQVTIYNNSTAASVGTAYVVRTSNTEVFIVNNQPTGSYNLASANLIGQSTGTSSKIVRYDHYTGRATAANTNSITLAVDANSANNVSDYNASVIFVAAGTGLGQSATITSYNPATRVAMISGTWTTTPIANDSSYSIGRMKTTAAGDVAGIFTIPASTFRIGEKKLRLIDNNINDVVSSTTNGDASFFAQGAVQTVEATILSVTQPTIQRTTVAQAQPISKVTGSSSTQAIVGWYDPLAQTFLIDPNTYPQGMYISRIRACFKSKDAVVPVTLQLRPTVNGVPSSSVIYPNGTVTLTPDKVKITDSPSLDDATKYTEFKFDSPIYMQPGEHSFVFFSNSNKYETYIAEIGKLDIVQQRQISEQAYGGSLFLSQNGSTWTADQTSDMLFRIYRSVFSTTPASLKFNVIAPSSNVPYDLVHLITNDLVLGNTSVAYTFNTTVDAGGGSTGFQPILPLQDYYMDDGYGRRVITTSNNSFVLQAVMSTLNPSVSPVVDSSRSGATIVENIINNLPLRNSEIFITSSGTGYANSTDVTVSITGGNGSGATASANVLSNTINSVYITNGGSGYTTSPTITITPGSGGGSGAAVTYNGEDKQLGGNANVRYMTRKVILNDGFDSGDLRVYLTGYKPSNSNIYVYYKILSKSDGDLFDNKNYQLMTELGNENFVATSRADYRELTFAPGTGGVANNSVGYTTSTTGFSTFRTFAIKIVMTGIDTVDVPKVRDIRAIAFPSGV